MIRTTLTLIVGAMLATVIYTTAPALNDKATEATQGMLDAAKGWAAN